MILDLERLQAAPLNSEPFEFVIVENFLRPEHLPALLADFPIVRRHGSFPLGGLAYGAAFHRARSIRASMVTHALTVTTWRMFFS